MLELRLVLCICVGCLTQRLDLNFLVRYLGCVFELEVWVRLYVWLSAWVGCLSRGFLIGRLNWMFGLAWRLDVGVWVG